MAIVRGNARLVGGFLAILFMGLMAWWVANAIPESQATLAFLPPEPAQPLTRLDAARLNELRQDVGLTDDALGVLDFSDVQLDGVLTDLREWYFSNEEQLAAARSAVADAQASIRVLKSRLSTGDPAEGLAEQLATSKTTLATATAAYETLITTARTSVMGNESPQQLALLERMRNFRETPMPFRALDLTVEQRRALTAALNAYGQRVSVAGNQEVPGVDWAAIVGAQNFQQMGAINAVRGPASHRVVAALTRNLPVEPDPMPTPPPGTP